ncbi:amidophosphoribosyltransferase [Oceanirhabdus sp. W0125-5]|uniref:amidophosphoribosyltransferase n=1 Tax=Oceanirhabdus sp. W0125-5 TaxID=2999116 RepID=UPI0022F2BCC2|nr:amidophosphoribosyltransferase [Oceanirhabdus sp. W0125-5]WBW98073.1 amidophosphoribosyltransferase [Oceanirhabdus sp. W0125-5]
MIKLWINSREINEECGVFGIWSKNEEEILTDLVIEGLHHLQHRGQESAGIASVEDGNIKCHKGMGLVQNVFGDYPQEQSRVKAAIGHVRYSTKGESSIEYAHPFVDDDNTISICHNGNVSFDYECENDTKEILDSIMENINNSCSNKKVEDVLIKVLKEVHGSYAILILMKEKLIAIRDPKGIRPLSIGILNGKYIVSSESCSIDAIGGKFEREIQPGEMFIISDEGISSHFPFKEEKGALCSFEYIYFSREDSILGGQRIINARKALGAMLWSECNKKQYDLVIGVPSSGIPAALGYSNKSGIPFEIGFAKNRYIGRTFINSDKSKMRENVRKKLIPIGESFKGKRIVLIDDSIVRGNTMKVLIQEIRKYEPKEIHLKIASPIIKNPCMLGISTPTKMELLGGRMNEEEIKEYLEVDSIQYLSIEGFQKALGSIEICRKCY